MEKKSPKDQFMSYSNFGVTNFVVSFPKTIVAKEM